MQPSKDSEPSLLIEGRRIGRGEPPYVVAEMSGNHNGDLGRAIALLDSAREAGADAVKIQTYRANTITIDHDGPDFVVSGGLWAGRRLFGLYEEAHTPWEWHEPIFVHARRIGLTVFSSPFDPTAVELLERLGCPAYKIASPELVDLPLIECVARTGKPLIISTGMGTADEIGEAVSAARRGSATQIAVLHCTAAYPAPPSEANLLTIAEIARRFGVVAGLSDHTLGTAVSVAAVALGANIIEKHFTLARADGGVDSAFSLESGELAGLVKACAEAHVAVGVPTFGPTSSEQVVLRNRRSLYVVAPVRRGETICASNVRSIRPGRGLLPKHLDAVLGRRAARDLAFGEPLDWSMIEGGGNA